MDSHADAGHGARKTPRTLKGLNGCVALAAEPAEGGHVADLAHLARRQHPRRDAIALVEAVDLFEPGDMLGLHRRIKNGQPLEPAIDLLLAEQGLVVVEHAGLVPRDEPGVFVA